MYRFSMYFSSWIFLANILQSHSYDHEIVHNAKPSYQEKRKLETVLSWDKLEFDINWSQTQEQDNVEYVYENNLLGNVRIYKNAFYISVPRYQNGVPATLNIVRNSNGRMDREPHNSIDEHFTSSPKLDPFPSLEQNLISDCSSLQNVFAIEIDPFGRLWVVDSGNAELYTGSRNENTTPCNAKLHIYELGKV